MTDIHPHIARLFIHPIKALDRVALDQVILLKSGALKHDREFAIFDHSGNFVNGKRNKRVHALRSQFDLINSVVSIQAIEQTAEFHILKEREAFEAWLQAYFGFPVQIRQNLEMGFPDDTLSPGPTIISTATLAAIASWYPGLDIEEVRLRFRTNIEIDGVPAFWEDHLFTTAGQTVDFQIGNVKFLGINPCQRCVVITRNAATGEPYPSFQKMFVTKRRETLPNWVEKSRFNHFYRLAINTRLPSSEAGKTISIGDQLSVVS